MAGTNRPASPTCELMTTTFLLIRHGMTDAVGQVATGRQPGVMLNDEGREHVATLPQRLGTMPIDAVYASPMERTVATAYVLARALGLDVRLEPRFIEIEYGGWSGRRYADLTSDPIWAQYNTVRSISRPPSGELLLDVQQRAVSAMLDLQAAHPGQTVAIVSHGDVLRAILQYFLGMPIDFVLRLELSPGRISVLQIGAGAPRVLQVNGDTALPVG